MQTPFVNELRIGNELHLYLASYEFLVEMGCEVGDKGQTQNCVGLEQSVQQHIADKHPDTHISRVKVFLGSVLVATLTVASTPMDAINGNVAQAATATTTATTTIGLVVNGQVLTTAQPFTKGGQVMVPTLAFARSLGVKASYDSATQKLTITAGDKRLIVTIGNQIAELNGQAIDLGAAPVLVANTSYVPVRAVAEAFGGRVAWDGARQTVIVSNQQVAVYQVQSGDSLWGISRKFGTNPASIQALNGLGTGVNLVVGNFLIVPRNSTTYVAKAEDTLWQLSRQFNTTVDAIKAASGLTTDTLYGGMVLLIPEATPTTPAPTPAPVPVPAGARSHTVVAGDTLWGVATTYRTTVAAIRDANKLTTDTLRVGQTLIIPAATPTTPAPAPTTTQPGEYIVQTGDTIWGLAHRFNTTPEAIRKASNLTSDSLRLGQRIYIPGYTPAPPPPAESYLQHADPKIVNQLAKDTFVFPFRDARSYDPFRDTWGDSRGYNPGSTATRDHEGTDIFAPKGAALVAVGSGTIIRYGWNELGGWRVTISLDNSDYAVYYAHLASYAPGLYKGARVTKGQLIGYVGSTGYGPAGTSGKFVNHLHFGLYDEANGFEAVNPYHILKYWEARR